MFEIYLIEIQWFETPYPTGLQRSFWTPYIVFKTLYFYMFNLAVNLYRGNTKVGKIQIQNTLVVKFWTKRMTNLFSWTSLKCSLRFFSFFISLLQNLQVCKFALKTWQKFLSSLCSFWACWIKSSFDLNQLIKPNLAWRHLRNIIAFQVKFNKLLKI